MGNSSGLAYDIEDGIEYKNGAANWQLHNAVKQAEKDEMRERVCIFRLSKATAAAQLPLAQRNVQRLKTLRHPNVLAFVESAEMDDSIALVTESCLPCEEKIKQLSISDDEKEQNEVAQDLIWGFKCILQAVQFLHDNGSLMHGNLGLHSIFVTPGGDWKLGAFELSTNMSNAEDRELFLKNHATLDRLYWPPERVQLAEQSGSGSSGDILMAKLPPYYIDIFALGQCIQKAFQLARISQPRSIGKYLSSMLHSEFKKRPTASKLLQSAMFNSEHVRFHESVEELVLKSPKDFIESVSKMDEKIVALSKSVCAHKILPNLSRAMQMAINDFPQRDARESCRQLTQTSISMLCKLAIAGKVDEVVFQRSCVPTIIQLWSMTDRTIRTTMLQSLKDLSNLLPGAVINKNIFDNVLAGFSDSSSKLRESTLMSLIYIVDKLEETQFQDRLVRVVCNMQNDVEAPIRTNATIFIGKIAPKMKEGVRTRVLCNSLLKAMKDNFVHCRIAGLKTANACLAMIDIGQMATKLLPQASVLCLDKSMDVRSLALALIESSLASLRKYNAQVVEKMEEERKRRENIDMKSGLSGTKKAVENPSDTSNLQGNKNYGELPQSKQQDSSWSSWSVLQGLSKTLENATISATTPAESTVQSNLDEGSKTVVVDSACNQQVVSGASGQNLGEDQFVSEGGIEDFGHSGLSIIQEQEFSAEISGQGWENDMLDDLILDGEDETNSSEFNQKIDGRELSTLDQLPGESQTLPAKAVRSASDNLSTNSKDKSTTKTSKSAKTPKAVVKKLVTNDDDNWDDF